MMQRSLSFIKRLPQIFRQIMCAIIAPPFCAYCKQFLSERIIFCDYCRLRILPIFPARISITHSKQMLVYAASDYKEPLKPLILSKIWSNQPACKQLATIMWNMSGIAHINFDIIVPVPLHWTRQAYRGYNQAYTIAQEIAQLSNRPLVDLAMRTRYSIFQSKVSFTHRFSNVDHIFSLKPNALENLSHYQNKHILIIDDLMTSGATLQQLAKILQPLKPSTISAAVACRVI